MTRSVETVSAMKHPTVPVSRWKLSPRLWAGGRFPTLDEYRRILRRGRLLYALQADGFQLPVLTPREAAARPCNMLYHTATGGEGYSRRTEWGFKGCARNEELLPTVPAQRRYFRGLHAQGIPALVYQNENNFDQSCFSKKEIAAMDAELDPFTWAFGNPGRRFACVNKPAWRRFLLERLKIRVGAYEADGVFLDNNTPFIHCRCAHCRRLYAERHGGDLLADMGREETVVADMRVFDYVGMKQVPKQLARLDDPRRLRYYEWRVERLVDFYRTLRAQLEQALSRRIVYTANGHVAIAEQTGVQLSHVFDMHFSEDGFTAPPVSNGFIVRVGAALGQDVRGHFTITRTMESMPVKDMAMVLAAEGRALGGNAEFWDYNYRLDDRLAQGARIMRRFFMRQADTIFGVEQDLNDIALLYSWRSDLWTGQSISPARYAAELLEDINQPYDVLFAEREADLALLDRHRAVIAPHVEILPNAWFRALQRFIERGGRLVTTGHTARLNERLQRRAGRWHGVSWTHFAGRPEKDYAAGRKEIGIHHTYRRPAGPWVAAVDRALGVPTLRLEPATALLAVNHTRLPDGEAVHLVNRHVNVFPRIFLRPREGLALRLIPQQPVRRIEWLSPTQPARVLPVKKEGRALRIALPPLEVYGIVRVRY